MFFIDLFLKTAFKWRDSVCLGMFFFGAPMIYFFRDGLGMAAGSSAFTFAFMFGPLFLLLPFRSLNKFYKSNSFSYSLGISFLIMCIIYLYTFAPNRGWFTNVIYETVVIGMVLYMYLSFSLVSVASLEKRFLQVAIYISLIGSFFLLLYLIRNPAYAIGARASIELGAGENTTANPHIFARGAFLGLVGALMFLKHEKKASIQRMITIGGIVVFIAVIFLTQAMSTLIATVLFFAFYFRYSVSLFTVKHFVKKQFTKWYFWVIIVGVFAYASNFYSKNREPIRIAFEVVTVRGEKLLNTFFDTSSTTTNATVEKVKKDAVQVDGSASGRIETFNKLVENIDYNIEHGNITRLLFGNGYHQLYVDIPVLEPLNSFGIVGFLFFLLFFFYLSYQAFKEIKRPRSITSEFIAYAYIYFFVYTLTNGLIIDYIRWGYFALACRFLSIPFFNNNNISKV